MVGKGHRPLSAWRNVLVLAASQALALSCAVLRPVVRVLHRLAGLALPAANAFMAASGTGLGHGWQVLAPSALPPLIIAAAVAAQLPGRRRREDRSRRHASEGASA